MKIFDLTEEHKQLYFECLEDWSDEIKEAGSHKSCWYEKMKDKGLGVKLAKDGQGTIGGMIQFIPIEHSPAEGQNLYFIPCIWVHGYKKGRGNFQKKGMGKALLQAAEEDVRKRGSKGLVVWGVSMPFWMRASWYKKQGYKKVDNQKGAVLLWKPFVDDALPPRWVNQKKKPQSEPGKVIVSAFVNGSCTAQGMVFERAKRAAAEFGNQVEFRGFDTSDRSVFLEWGIYDGLFINDKQVRTGPPPSYKKIKKKIAKQTKKMT
jgi:GNAT superfamily N-acetyltransferase